MRIDLGSIPNFDALHAVALVFRFARDLLSPRKRLGLKAVLLFLFASAAANTQTVQFLPEVDTYLKLNPDVRVYFQAKEDRDAGADTQATLGPSVQFSFKPLVKLKEVAAFDLDDAKKRTLLLEAGYRYVTAPDAPVDNRFTTAVTLHFPVKGSVLISDRNRADLDWKGGDFKWRYRNKLTIQRTFAVGTYHLIPNASVEPYYTSQYAKWSTTALYLGCLLPVGKHVQFDPYYEHENNTGKSPNSQTDSIGLAVHLLFSLAK
jgi:hypothetical protein